MDVTGFFYVAVGLGTTNLALSQSLERSLNTSKSFTDLPLRPLKMSTEMFLYELYWEAPENADAALRYTARYSYKDDPMEKKRITGYELPNCEAINETKCNIESDVLKFGKTEYNLDLLFWVEGYNLESDKLVYKTESIFFNSRINVSLHTPDFELKLIPRVNGKATLFVLPKDQKHWRDGNSIGEHLKQLRYQVQYWSQNGTEQDIKNITEKYADREIEQEVNKGESYCVKLRLIARDDKIDITTVSEWSEPPQCVGSDVNVTTEAQLPYAPIIITCAGVTIIVVLILIVRCSSKIRQMCKRINEKGPLPDILLTIFQDGTNQQSDRVNRLHNFMTEEKVDVFPHLQSISHRENSLDLTVSVEYGCTSNATPHSRMSAQHGDDDYLQLPVFDDQTLAIDSAKFNMTYGIGYVYDSGMDNGAELSSGSSFVDRMSATLYRPLLASNISDCESDMSPTDPFWDRDRPIAMSISSSDSGMGRIFDIQRSTEASARSNVYLGQTPVDINYNPPSEVMNCAYSSNPTREIPDALFDEYKNISKKL